MKTGILSMILGLMIPLQCLAANVDVRLSPSETTILPGDSTFVDLVGSYDGTDRLLGGAVSLGYRAGLLTVLSVTLRAPSDVAGTTGSVVVSGDSGTVSGIGFASFAGVAGTFIIATVEFRSLGVSGISTLTAFDPGDPVYVWVNEAFNTVSFTSSPGSITVSAIPEPGTVAMMLAGLAALRVVARSRSV